MALLHLVTYFFFLYQSPFSSLCTVFDSILSNIDEVLSISPSANFFVFGDFNVHHKDWLTYSGGTDRPGELCYNLCELCYKISNDLTQIVNCPTLTVTLTVLLFWISFFLLTLVLVLQQRLSLHWEILIMLLPQFPLTFQLNQNRMPRLIVWLMTILVLIGMVFVIIREMFHGRIPLNSVLLLLLVNFVSEFRLELMYIHLIVTIRPNLTNLHGFQQLVLLP